MGLDEQLEELLARLGVELEEPAASDSGDHDTDDGEEEQRQRARSERARFSYGVRPAPESHDDGAGGERDDAADDLEANIRAASEMSLFQTSREHYGVFYRLDLADGLPQLRIFLPDDDESVKMRCYFVRATPGTPLHGWFTSAREHEGSRAYEDARDTAQQHLLFAVGELMKRLFWGGDVEAMRFPAEIEVVRLL